MVIKKDIIKEVAQDIKKGMTAKAACKKVAATHDLSIKGIIKLCRAAGIMKTRGRKMFDGKDPNVVLQKLEMAWAVDASDAEAAFFADISPPALCAYLKKNPKITERKEALKNKPKFAAKVSVANALPSNPELALKYLERRAPKEYAPLQRQAATDNEGNNLSPVFNKTESKL